MRTGSILAILGMSSLILSGCSKLESVDLATSTGSGETVAAGTTGEDPTGSETGTSKGQSNTTGSQSYVFNDGAFVISGESKTNVEIANAGGGVNVETATVSVNTGFADMTWSDTIEMALFRTSVSGLPTDGLSKRPDYYNDPGTDASFRNYKEYRKITSTTDAELQVWKYRYSSISQYTVFNDPSAGNNNNVSVFFDGQETPTSALPSGTATYNGKFGGTAEASNWGTPERTVDDPFDPDGVTGETYDPNGTWRVAGDVRVTANFGSGRVNGVIDNLTWRKFETDRYITLTPAETNKPFTNYTFTASITDNKYSGTVAGPSGRVVNGNNAVHGGFFGPSAQETAGIIAIETTSPSPSDGITNNEDNRRGYVNLRGIFHGTR